MPTTVINALVPEIKETNWAPLLFSGLLLFLIIGKGRK